MSPIKKEYPKNEVVLRLLHTGVVLSVFINNPHSIRAVFNAAFGSTFEPNAWNNFPRNQLKKTIDRLRKRKLVRLTEKGKETIVELTSLGRNEIIRFDINQLQLEKPGTWDGKWWQVIFDIPDAKKVSRNNFQRKLKELGFFFIQESVGLYPFPCQKEIEFLREVFEIKKYVNIFRVDYFEDEYLIKRKFNL